MEGTYGTLRILALRFRESFQRLDLITMRTLQLGNLTRGACDARGDGLGFFGEPRVLSYALSISTELPLGEINIRLQLLTSVAADFFGDLRRLDFVGFLLGIPSRKDISGSLGRRHCEISCRIERLGVGN